MSRRDTIIISVLINAGLLAILFATAWNSDDDEVTDPVAVRQAMEEVREGTMSRSESTSPVAADAVDQVLQQHGIAGVVSNPSISAEEVSNVTRTTEAEGAYVEVTVKRGDNLDRIARANGVTVEAIMKASGLTSTALQIGQMLKVPKVDSTAVIASTTSTARTVASSEAAYYIVQQGDNPWNIARHHGIKLQELLRINDLDENKARNLRVGDKLRIR